MEERMAGGSTPEGAPIDHGGSGSEWGGPPHLANPRALQILTTEHWSLLASRSLSYNESFTRAGMFLSFLAASLVALALIAQATRFTTDLAIIAALVLALDLFIGLATLGRINDASQEELHCVRGMNRIRHAYREMAPGLEPYFVTGFHDDAAGILSAYGVFNPSPSSVASIWHGFTTAPGMIATIDAVLIGSLAAVIALGVGASAAVATIVGLTALALAVVGFLVIAFRSAIVSMRAYPARFPTPSDTDEPGASTPSS